MNATEFQDAVAHRLQRVIEQVRSGVVAVEITGTTASADMDGRWALRLHRADKESTAPDPPPRPPAELIKPCPFCARPGEIENENGIKWYIECAGLCCKGPVQLSRAAAIQAWNRRPRSPLADAKPALHPRQCSSCRPEKRECGHVWCTLFRVSLDNLGPFTSDPCFAWTPRAANRLATWHCAHCGRIIGERKPDGAVCRFMGAPICQACRSG
jgi:hypothetical protein